MEIESIKFERVEFAEIVDLDIRFCGGVAEGGGKFSGGWGFDDGASCGEGRRVSCGVCDGAGESVGRPVGVSVAGDGG